MQSYFRYISKYIRPVNNQAIQLGRWKLKQSNDNTEIINNFWNNSDHCGDVICGDPIKNKQILEQKLNTSSNNNNTTTNTSTTQPTNTSTTQPTNVIKS